MPPRHVVPEDDLYARLELPRDATFETIEIAWRALLKRHHPDVAGREILYDDRDESPGVKFTDAELLGMPTILTVSPRSLAAGGVEVKDRATGEATTRPIEEVEAMLTGSEAVPA